MEQLELTFTIAGSVDWYKHFEKKVLGSFYQGWKHTYLMTQTFHFLATEKHTYEML